MEPQQLLELGFIKANDDFLIDGNHRQMHPAWELLEAFLGRCVCCDIVGCETDPCLRKKLFRRFARASGRCGVHCDVFVHRLPLDRLSGTHKRCPYICVHYRQAASAVKQHAP